MKLVLAFYLSFITFLSFSQTKQDDATLRVIYSDRFLYDSILINIDRAVIQPVSFTHSGNKIESEFLIPLDSLNTGAFSIAFIKSGSNHPDTLYFQIRGQNPVVEFEDSFSLGSPVMRLTNAYNFENLFLNLEKYRESGMKNYMSSNSGDADRVYTSLGYMAKLGFDFLRLNINNLYAPYLFVFPVIHPPGNTVSYDEAYSFYIQYLKPEIEDKKTREWVEKMMQDIKPALKNGSRLPHFNATTIYGQSVSPDTFRGKYVLYTFWATWCAPCMKELPELKRIYHDYHDIDLKILSFSLDSDSLKLIEVTNKEGIQWPLVFNRNDIVGNFGVNAIPVCFLADESGGVIYNSLLDEEEATTQFKKLRKILELKRAENKR